MKRFLYGNSNTKNKSNPHHQPRSQNQQISPKLNTMRASPLPKSQPPKRSTNAIIDRLRGFRDDEHVKFKVIVAIDFGTHGTALGYAMVTEDEKEQRLYIEQDWSTNVDAKNKTDILLTHDGKFITFGDDALKKLYLYSHSIIFTLIN